MNVDWKKGGDQMKKDDTRKEDMKVEGNQKKDVMKELNKKEKIIGKNYWRGLQISTWMIIMIIGPIKDITIDSAQFNEISCYYLNCAQKNTLMGYLNGMFRNCDLIKNKSI